MAISRAKVRWIAVMSARLVGAARHIGSSSQATLVVQVLYPRVLAHAHRTASPTARVLAYALAHEIGHIVLPGGHTRGGLMRAALYGRIGHLPTFTADQGTPVA